MAADIRKTIVISAINFTEGGPLTVLTDLLEQANITLGKNWHIIALVNNKNLFQASRISYLQFPLAKKSWIIRIYYEWIGFWFLSNKLDVDLWLSFHDITPNVKAKRQSVYCHNGSPFFKASWNQVYLEPKFWLFTKLYDNVYRLNINNNYHVIIQQEWIYNEFKRRYGVDRLLLAHPDAHKMTINKQPLTSVNIKRKKVLFFYPAIPRVIKNFEVICEAFQNISLEGVDNIELILTFNGSESRYASRIYNKYKKCNLIKFIGQQDLKTIGKIYKKTDCLIFSSLLETWGLPITEAKANKIPLMVADLPYARETVGNYHAVRFFNPNDPAELTTLINDFISSKIVFDKVRRKHSFIKPIQGWDSLLKVVTKGL